jgi:Uma2 family endonuclease
MSGLVHGRIISSEAQPDPMATPISEAIVESWNPALTVQLAPLITLTGDQLFDFCRINRDLRIERTAQGALVLMAPAGAESGARNAELTHQLVHWAHGDGSGGIAFDSSSGFTLPNGAMRSPDASWVRRDRWMTLSVLERRKFPRLCPDFVAELRSPFDQPAVLQAKLQEYLDNGARLGWLLDPERRTAHVYRPGQAIEILVNPDELSGDPVLPGFTLDLRPIW